MFEKFGADTMRFYLMNSLLMRGQDMNFKEEGLQEVYRKIILLLTNVYKFYELFKGKNKEFNDSSSPNVLDKWIISRNNELIKTVSVEMDDYNTLKTCEAITTFIDDLSTWYVRRSRGRFKKGDNTAIKTLAYVLNNLIKVMAPITPFVTEYIHQGLRKTNRNLLESVHLEYWPKHDIKLISEEVNNKMSLARDIVSKALDQREKSKIGVRQPLNEIIVTGANLTEEYSEIIKDEVNIKKVEYKPGKELSIELDTKITPQLKMEGISRDLIRKINNERKKAKLTINDRITLYFTTSDEFVLKSFKDYEKTIMKSVQADKVEYKTSKQSKEVNVDKAKVSIGISF